MLTEMASNSTLQISLRNYPLWSYDIVSKNTLHNYLRLLKHSSPFQLFIHENAFFSYTSTKTANHKHMNSEIDMRIQIFS